MMIIVQIMVMIIMMMTIVMWQKCLMTMSADNDDDTISVTRMKILILAIIGHDLASLIIIMIIMVTIQLKMISRLKKER